jgi:putative lipoic acid-binding regulatory protein
MQNPQQSSSVAEEILKFPQAFPLKIMGRNVAELKPVILQFVQQHAPDFDPNTVQTRDSKNGNYIALTCTINAISRAQLDAIYQALSKHPLVAYML